MTVIQNDTIRLVTRLAMTLLLVSLAAYDVRYHRVPNRVVRLLLLAGVGITLVRLWLGRLGPQAFAIMGFTWAACIVLWWLHAFGGGDMKLVMALITLAPDMRLIYLMLGAALGGLLLILIIDQGRPGFRRLAALLAAASQGVLPDRAEISTAYQSRGRPITFAFCLAGVVYIWFFWVGV